jgi:hypothetical protein
MCVPSQLMENGRDGYIDDMALMGMTQRHAVLPPPPFPGRPMVDAMYCSANLSNVRYPGLFTLNVSPSTHAFMHAGYIF